MIFNGEHHAAEGMNDRSPTSLPLSEENLYEQRAGKLRMSQYDHGQHKTETHGSFPRA